MNELEMRSHLISKLSSTSAGKNASFISEMFIDGFSRRADLIMAGDKLAVFEIKSDLDSLVRLDGQLNSYLRFFEQVTVVCAQRHLKGIEARASMHVGIWMMRVDGVIVKVRDAKTFRQECQESWLSFLPVDELRAFLRTQGLRISGNRSDLLGMCQALPMRTVRTYVLAFLKRRDERIKARREKSSCSDESLLSEEARLSSFIQSIPATQLVPIPRVRSHSSKPSVSSPSSPV